MKTIKTLAILAFLQFCYVIMSAQVTGASITPSASAVCKGSSYTITATATGTGTMTYSWSTGVTSTSNTYVVTPTSTTSYSLTVSSSVTPTITKTASVTITVNALPTVTVSPSTSTVCIGKSATITASGASTYIWSNGATTAARTVTPTVATTYFVTGTNANGCKATSSASVAVNAVPTVTLTASPSSIVAGVVSTLTASGASTYAWSSGGGSSATQTVSPSVTTLYTVTGTAANACTGTASATVTVNGLWTRTGSTLTPTMPGDVVTLSGTHDNYKLNINTAGSSSNGAAGNGLYVTGFGSNSIFSNTVTGKAIYGKAAENGNNGTLGYSGYFEGGKFAVMPHTGTSIHSFGFDPSVSEYYMQAPLDLNPYGAPSTGTALKINSYTGTNILSTVSNDSYNGSYGTSGKFLGGNFIIARDTQATTLPNFAVNEQGLIKINGNFQNDYKLKIDCRANPYLGGGPGLCVLGGFGGNSIYTGTVLGNAIYATVGEYMGNYGTSGKFIGGNFLIARNDSITPDFLVNKDGNISIGTDKIYTDGTDLYKLSVNGKIACTELKVQLYAQWPDFVCGERYELRSLG